MTTSKNISTIDHVSATDVISNETLLDIVDNLVNSQANPSATSLPTQLPKERPSTTRSPAQPVQESVGEGRRQRTSNKEGKQRVRTVNEAKELNRRIISANVGGMGFVRRSEGSAQHSLGGALTRAPNSRFQRVLTWMKETTNGKRKRNILFVLTETQTRGDEVQEIKDVLRKHGYSSVVCVGVKGGPRGERAGVTVAWDHTQLFSQEIGRSRKHHRVIVRGRVVQMRFSFSRLRGASHDIDLVAAYPPTRGQSPRGGITRADREEVSRCWRRITHVVTRLSGLFRVLLVGDLNAETLAMLRLRRAGGGAGSTPSDLWLESIIDNLSVQRLGEVQPTYIRGVESDAPVETIIDHMVAGARVVARVGAAGVMEGAETGQTVHLALYAEIVEDKPVEATPGLAAKMALPVCSQEKGVLEACLREYHMRLPTAYGRLLEREHLLLAKSAGEIAAKVGQPSFEPAVERVIKAKGARDILQLPASGGVSMREIRSSFRKVAIEVHPDKGSGLGRTQAFMMVKQAEVNLRLGDDGRQELSVLGAEALAALDLAVHKDRVEREVRERTASQWHSKQAVAAQAAAATNNLDSWVEAERGIGSARLLELYMEATQEQMALAAKKVPQGDVNSDAKALAELRSPRKRSPSARERLWASIHMLAKRRLHLGPQLQFSETGSSLDAASLVWLNDRGHTEVTFWKQFVPARDTLHRGVPRFYAHFKRDSEVTIAMAAAYDLDLERLARQESNTKTLPPNWLKWVAQKRWARELAALDKVLRSMRAGS